MRYVTDPRSKVTETQYDNAWRVTQDDRRHGERGREHATTRTGRRTAWSILEKDGGSQRHAHATRRRYDDGGRMTQRREIDRTNGSNVYTTDYAYDSRGNLLWTVNAEGNPTPVHVRRRRAHDEEGGRADGRLADHDVLDLASTRSGGSTRTTDFVSFKDDAANESTWAYDAKDRQTTMTYPNSHVHRST